MTTARRFYQSGGQLFADRRPVSLEWAQEKCFEWWTEARACQRKGYHRIAALYRREADALQAAKQEADRWARASGPNAAEAYTNKVRQMLAESVKAGERA